MANHFISINRGKQGVKIADFTAGTSTTAGDDIELRIADAASLTKKDVEIALLAFGRYIKQWRNSGFPDL